MLLVQVITLWHMGCLSKDIALEPKNNISIYACELNHFSNEIDWYSLIEEFFYTN